MDVDMFEVVVDSQGEVELVARITLSVIAWLHSTWM